MLSCKKPLLDSRAPWLRLRGDHGYRKRVGPLIRLKMGPSSGWRPGRPFSSVRAAILCAAKSRQEPSAPSHRSTIPRGLRSAKSSSAWFGGAVSASHQGDPGRPVSDRQ